VQFATPKVPPGSLIALHRVKDPPRPEIMRPFPAGYRLAVVSGPLQNIPAKDVIFRDLCPEDRAWMPVGTVWKPDSLTAPGCFSIHRRIGSHWMATETGSGT
jgi:hypothetical protein